MLPTTSGASSAEAASSKTTESSSETSRASREIVPMVVMIVTATVRKHARPKQRFPYRGVVVLRRVCLPDLACKVNENYHNYHHRDEEY